MNVQEMMAGMRRGETRLAELAARLSAVDLEKECYAGGWKNGRFLHYIPSGPPPSAPGGRVT